MALKTILVPLAGTDTDTAALSAAFTVAKAFSAHVDGLYVRLDARDAVPMLGEGMSGTMVEEIMRAADEEANNHLTSARRAFDSAVQSSGAAMVTAPPAPGGASARWREEEGRMDEIVAREGRLADLVVFGHGPFDKDAQALVTVEQTLLGAGRPVLLAPAGVPSIGRRVAVAWNGSAEGARALTGAMPFVEAAETVHVLTAETSVTSPAAGGRIAEYLAWQGVNAQLTIVKPGSEPVGKALTNKAADLGADLLVMGGYGHSRMREMILGGVTRYMLSHPGLPVLMAH